MRVSSYMLIPMQHISVLRIFSSFASTPNPITYAKYQARRQRVVNFPSESVYLHWFFNIISPTSHDAPQQSYKSNSRAVSQKAYSFE